MLYKKYPSMIPPLRVIDFGSYQKQHPYAFYLDMLMLKYTIMLSHDRQLTDNDLSPADENRGPSRISLALILSDAVEA